MHATAEPAAALDRSAMASAEVWSTLINLAGRQRMLSQRIVLMAVLHDRDDRSARAAAREALEQFRRAHAQLAVGGEGLPPPPPAVREALHGGGHWGADGLEAAVQSFIALAEQALHTEPARAQAALVTLVVRATPMLVALNRLTQIYESLSHQSAATQQQRQGELIRRIESIAREARIVSMNARIAAARAGDAGREFGVVASRLVEISAQIEATSREALR
jgi:hypothetical protein